MKRKLIHQPYEVGDLVYTRSGLLLVLSNVGTFRYRVMSIRVHKVINTETHKHTADMLVADNTVRVRRLKPGRRVRHLNSGAYMQLGTGLLVPKLHVGKRSAAKRLSAAPLYQ
jgi:hypothetical protein